MKLDYVIVSSDDNQMYLPFWDVIRPVIIKRLNVKLILVKISDKDKISIYDHYIVHELKAIDNLNTGFQAQISRLFVTKFYSENVCMTSDIDMLLINKEYFYENIKNIREDSIGILSSDAYNDEKYPMCYNVAKGKTFSEILKLEDLTFDEFCKKLHTRKQGWSTDEKFFAEMINNFDQDRIQKFKRGFIAGKARQRLDRSNWNYLPKNVENFIDSHLLRPYHTNKHQIDKFIDLIT